MKHATCLLFVLQCGLLQVSALSRPGPPYVSVSGTRSRHATLVLGPPNRGREQIDGYRIYYGPSANPRNQDSTTFMSTTPERQSMFYTQYNLQPATNYTFRVAASQGWTGDVVTVFAITKPESIPGRVTITSSHIGDKQYMYILTWQKNSRDQASNQVDHYDITWGEANSTEAINTVRIYDGELNPENKSTIIPYLQSETKYWVTVTAKNYLGEAPPSLPFSFTTIDYPKSAPQVTIKYISQEFVELELLPPVRDGGGPILSYDVETPGVINHTYTVPASQDASTPFVVKVENLKPATQYTLNITATNALGRSPGKSLDITTKAIGTPGRAVITSVKETTFPDRYHLTWDVPETGGIPIKETRIHIRKVPSAIMETKTIPDDPLTPVTSYTITRLLANTTYVFTLQLMNDIGLSENSDPVRVTTAETAVTPGEVEELKTISTTATKITVEIEAPDSDGGSPIQTYRLQYWNEGDKSDSGTILDFAVTDGNRETMTVTMDNLQAATNYIFRVKAINAVGEGPPVVREAQTKQMSEPGKVTFTSPATSTEPTLYVLMWEEPETGGAPISYYVIRLKESGEDEYTVTSLDGSMTFYAFQNLKPGTTYSVQVLANNKVGRSAPNEFSFTTAKAKHVSLQVELSPADVTNIRRPEWEDLVLSCAARGLDDGVIPEIKWLYNGQEVTHHVHRLMTRSPTAQLKKLYIFHLSITDSGNYTCQVEAGGTVQHKSISLEIYKDILVTAPLLQYPEVGKDALIECHVTGDPTPTVWWTHDRTYIPDGGRYSYEKHGLRIRNVTRTDRGLYMCVGETAARGRLKEKKIAVIVS